MLQQIRTLTRRKVDFGFESTLRNLLKPLEDPNMFMLSLLKSRSRYKTDSGLFFSGSRSAP
jgi:hypothetical protein